MGFVIAVEQRPALQAGGHWLRYVQTVFEEIFDDVLWKRLVLGSSSKGSGQDLLSP